MGQREENQKIIKRIVIFILAIMMFGCAATYASLFEQTVNSNKRLEEYEKLLEPLELVSDDVTNVRDSEEIVQQLLDIKSIFDSTDETGPKTNRLNQVRNFSVGFLIVVAILGIVVECIDERNRKKSSISIGSTPSSNDAQKNPDNKVGCITNEEK